MLDRPPVFNSHVRRYGLCEHQIPLEECRIAGCRGMLTPREYEVVRRFALGQTWPTVQADLSITQTTVHAHRRNALAKYGAHRMVELYAALGWLHVPGDTP